jgi:uncharacterized membrane protein
MPLSKCKRLDPNRIKIAIIAAITFVAISATSLTYALLANPYFTIQSVGSVLIIPLIGVITTTFTFIAIFIIDRTKFIISSTYKENYTYYDKVKVMPVMS